MEDDELDARLERLWLLLDLYRYLPPGGQELIEKDVRAVCMALLGWEEPALTWTR